jgi:hypothetical protein
VMRAPNGQKECWNPRSVQEITWTRLKGHIAARRAISGQLEALRTSHETCLSDRGQRQSARGILADGKLDVYARQGIL